MDGQKKLNPDQISVELSSRRLECRFNALA